jgi:hypothetical protein
VQEEGIPSPNVALVKASEVPTLLGRIRPAWQAKDLIERVRRLINVDPSSACQRLFNATIHDLKEKIIIAGIDIAREAAKQYKLPPIEKAEDIEDYSASKLIDLAHRIGFLTRPDWRRLSRCYEIRRDLEHEDDEYEAGVEDCIYIFQTCISVVLSKDPIQLIRVADVKDLIEQPNPAIPALSLLEDYKHAPQPRQEEILKFLVAMALDTTQAELVRLNAFSFISHLSGITQNQVKLAIAAFLQEKITRSGPSRIIIRVAYVAGVLPYLKQAHLRDYFVAYHKEMEQVGPQWRKHAQHGELLRSFKDVGGLQYCPQDARVPILKWLVFAYIGESGGRTSFGNVREVFYSNTAAPLIEELISASADLVRDDLLAVFKDREVQRACYTVHIKRRLESLNDLVDPQTVEKVAVDAHNVETAD